MNSLTVEDLSPEEILQHYLRAKSHPGILAEYTKIRDETDSSILEFELWEWQKELLTLMMEEKYMIILKARQLGASWLAALLALWTAIFFPNSNVLLLSKKEEDAENFLDKCRFLLYHLPSFLRPVILKDSSGALQFGYDYDPVLKVYKSKSTISALPATEDAGRSQTATLVISDENAFHPYAEKNFAAIQPTIAKGNARFIAISTANGTGNFFATTFKMARQGLNKFRWIFLAYWLRPGRDENWYAETKKAMAMSPMLFHQEFPRDPEEAFIASGGCIFDTFILNAMENEAKPPLDPEVDLWRWPKLQDMVIQHGVEVWKPPNPSHSYVMWTDPATSEHGTDYFCTRVMDVQTKEDVAAFHTKKDETYMTNVSYNLGVVYNYAFWGIERNGVGNTILHIATEYTNYPRNRIYHYKDINRKRKDQTQEKSPGFPATANNKEMLHGLGKKAVIYREAPIYDLALINEMKTYVEDPETHKVEAKEPDKDDRVSAWLGCLYLAEQPEATFKMRPQASPNAGVQSRLQGRGRRLS